MDREALERLTFRLGEIDSRIESLLKERVIVVDAMIEMLSQAVEILDA